MTGGIATTKMTTKGQVVIPQEMRKKLQLEPGTKFVVIEKGDSLTLKKIAEPRLERLEEIRKKAQANPLVRRLSRLSEPARVKEIDRIIHTIRR